DCLGPFDLPERESREGRLALDCSEPCAGRRGLGRLGSFFIVRLAGETARTKTGPLGRRRESSRQIDQCDVPSHSVCPSPGNRGPRLAAIHLEHGPIPPDLARYLRSCPHLVGCSSEEPSW